MTTRAPRIRRRRCIAALTAFLVLLGLAWYVFSPQGLLSTASAISTTLRWARLAEFPDTARDIRIEVTGNRFSRGFRISFRDDPERIRAWLATCEGPASAIPRAGKAGETIYRYEAGGGAQFARVRVSASGEEVRIRTWWS